MEGREVNLTRTIVKQVDERSPSRFSTAVIKIQQTSISHSGKGNNRKQKADTFTWAGESSHTQKRFIFKFRCLCQEHRVSITMEAGEEKAVGKMNKSWR